MIIQYLYHLSSISIFLGLMFEIYSYYFRSFIHQNMVLSTVISNWILYISRIFNVITMALLALIIETNQDIFRIFNIFIFSYFFASFYSFFVLHIFKKDLIFLIILYLIKLLYKIEVNYFAQKVTRLPYNKKLIFTSAFVTIFVFMAIISPSIAGYHFYDFRMSLTYVASIFNFLASGILLSYVEPSFASKANTRLYPSSFYSIFIGKISAMLVVPSSILLIQYLKYIG